MIPVVPANAIRCQAALTLPSRQTTKFRVKGTKLIREPDSSMLSSHPESPMKLCLDLKTSFLHTAPCNACKAPSPTTPPPPKKTNSYLKEEEKSPGEGELHGKLSYENIRLQRLLYYPTSIAVVQAFKVQIMY